MNFVYQDVATRSATHQKKDRRAMLRHTHDGEDRGQERPPRYSIELGRQETVVNRSDEGNGDLEGIADEFHNLLKYKGLELSKPLEKCGSSEGISIDPESDGYRLDDQPPSPDEAHFRE